jgi:hypothetical protein
MKLKGRHFIILFVLMLFFHSCSVMEKSSIHGFNSGYYKLKSGMENTEKVYVNVAEEIIDVYSLSENQPDRNEMMTISLLRTDTSFNSPLLFIKKSLDIDITTVLFKYHPSVHELPAQLNTDFNAALYAGWRRDNYRIKGNKDPLGKNQYEIVNRGFDFGLFAGTGTTLISPFTTNNARADEYNGFALQFGLAGFIESNVASFGIAAGFDYLLSPDRDIWIYNKKPWLGFIIGIALN